MRLRRLAAWVSVTTWAAACSGGAHGTESSVAASVPATVSSVATVSTTVEPTTTLPPGVDVQRGLADGHPWVLTTRTTEVDGELCLRLVWEGDTQGWSSCYVVVPGMGDVPWVDPSLPRGDARVHFLVGLAPLAGHTVRAVRGTTVLGEAEVFPHDTLHLGRLGFALPLTVPDVAALTRSVDVPGLGEPAVIGLLPPMEAVVLDADGVEVARGGRLVGSAVDVPCLLVGGDPATAVEMLFDPSMPLAGGVVPSSDPARAGYVVVAAGATYDVTVGGRTEHRDLVPVPGTSPQKFLAVAQLGPNDAMSTTFTILDADGTALETIVLGTYLGG